MSVSRRHFVRAGALGAAGVMSASCKWWCPWCKDPDISSSLRIVIKGLIIVERSPKSIAIHLVDAAKAGSTMQHYPVLEVPPDLVASANAPSTVVASMRRFDLVGKSLALDTGMSGSPSMSFNDDDISDTVPDVDHWKSLKLAARLETLCGATALAPGAASKFTSNLTLEHGQLSSTRPDSELGRQQIWEFTRTKDDGTKEKLTTQVMTNTLVCDVPVAGGKATFTIDGQPIVLNLTSPGAVNLHNMPDPKEKGTCSGPPSCVDHMEMFYDLVNFKYKPTARAVNVVATSPGAEPDYCPPGTVPAP